MADKTGESAAGRATDPKIRAFLAGLAAGRFGYSWPKICKPEPRWKPYLTFLSEDGFSLTAAKRWDGTLEYSFDTVKWEVWNGGTISAPDGVLHFRGTQNKIITGTSNRDIWRINSGAGVRCVGNIENLLDYETVADGEHPEMGRGCYARMFSGCPSLTEAPSLPATALIQSCYMSMFSGCASLVKAPELPATAAAYMCYYEMFYNCTSLTEAPSLPATTLADRCYTRMFLNCSGLIMPPSLPAARANYLCYSQMFQNCVNLIALPKLPALTVEDYCYERMFSGCVKIDISTQPRAYGYGIPYEGKATYVKLSGSPSTPSTVTRNMFLSCGDGTVVSPDINSTCFVGQEPV